MLTRKKLVVVILLIVFFAGVISVGAYIYLDDTSDSSKESPLDISEEDTEEIEDTRPVVSRYLYESVDVILAQDMPPQEKYNKLMAAGSGNYTDEDYDGAVSYIIAALSISGEGVDPRNVQGAKDYLAIIAKNEEISAESRAKIVEVVGQQALNEFEQEDNSNEI